MNGVRTGIAQHGVTDPKADIGLMCCAEFPQLDLKRVQVRALKEDEEVVHEQQELLHGPWAVDADDAQARGEPPEVAPAPGEHACPHGLLRREEGEEVVEGISSGRAPMRSTLLAAISSNRLRSALRDKDRQAISVVSGRENGG